MRLKWGNRFGPAREIHAGSGYWSQDSAIEVLAAPERATQLWVRWPGGRTTLTDVPIGAREITVLPSGALKQTRPGDGPASVLLNH
jgi:hypothetical protein